MFNKYISFLIFVFAIYYADSKAYERSKRAAYQLPGGADLLIGSFNTNFRCTSDGYFADIESGCQLFHICNTAQYADGKTEILQHTFICGNQTVFNQLTFTCDFAEEAVPCENAQDFFYLNERLGDPKALFHTENDIERAAPLIAARKGVSYQQRPVQQPRPAPRIQPLAPLPVPPASPVAGRRPFAPKPSRRQPARRY